MSRVPARAQAEGKLLCSSFHMHAFPSHSQTPLKSIVVYYCKTVEMAPFSCTWCNIKR
jgi:hypothetical protein